MTRIWHRGLRRFAAGTYAPNQTAHHTIAAERRRRLRWASWANRRG